MTVSMGAASVTVTTQPPGVQVLVDGVAMNGPTILKWVAGSSHTLDAISPTAGSAGVRYLWTGWSQGGTPSQTVIAPSGAVTYTANLNAQFLLTGISASGRSCRPRCDSARPGNDLPGGIIDPSTLVVDALQPVRHATLLRSTRDQERAHAAAELGLPASTVHYATPRPARLRRCTQMAGFCERAR